MSALFSSLPPETAQKRVQDPAEATAPPNKRAKLESAQPQSTSVKEAQLVGQDHVAAALIKITAHISSGRKFTKASELLRKLIADQNIGQEHSKLVFEALKASLRDTTNTEDPQLRREYTKLFTLASKAEGFRLCPWEPTNPQASLPNPQAVYYCNPSCFIQLDLLINPVSFPKVAP